MAIDNNNLIQNIIKMIAPTISSLHKLLTLSYVLNNFKTTNPDSFVDLSASQ